MASSSSQPRPEGADSGFPPSDAGAFAEGFPQVFGKYVLVRPMARGGMGELFLAAAGETGGFEKLCVVKKVLHSLEDAAVHRRFLDEAKVVVRLNHANLVQVFDAGRVDDEYFLAMELVEGKDLRAVWNRCAQLHRRIPVDIAIFVIRDILRGLHYVHDVMSLDLVHRDISPPNILVGYRGDVKLTDFGLAKSAIKREMTTPGVVFGRYSYLSPEQAKGMAADRRTDIYACAIVLWELLTGRQLFPSTNRSHQEALSAVRNPEVRPPSSLVPGVPEGMDAVVLKGLAKNPSERFQNAGEFRAALSDILARDYPRCDADRVTEFMREIFARESKMEARDLQNYAEQDFSDLRAQAEDSELISISDVIDSETGSKERDRSTITLGESDIVELEQDGRWDDGRPDAGALRQAAQSWVGKVIGQRYRVDSLIGVGGMGAVFRVTHLALGKALALKVLHSVYTRDADIIDRFMREARAATQTGHPNIIDVVDFGTTDEGDVYFVMELLEGRNLGRVVVDEGPLAVRRAVHIARQICRALSAAHEVGIIHRDLKSENVILTQRGKDLDFVKVLDFGICKQMNADSTTSPGLIMGSPDYMAPEQGAGLAATVSSDIYSVGCIMFETLTGRMPFSGRNAVDVLMQKGAHAAPRVTEFRSEIPAPLAGVIARCLARKAIDRPPSMRALEYELTRAVDGRASAVADVLGLASEQGSDEAAQASMSMQQAAVAAIGETQRQEHTQIAPHPVMTGPYPAASAGSSPLPAPTSSHSTVSPVMTVVRSLLFVALGGLLTGGVVLLLAPGILTGVDESASGQEGTAEQRSSDSAQEAVAAKASGETQEEDAAQTPTGGEQAAQPDAAADTDAVVVPVVDGAPGEDDGGDEVVEVPAEPAPAALVTQAEEALAKGHFREPYEGSMAQALDQLRAHDPGNEAIARLREDAAKQLMPVGRQSLSEREWEQAVKAFRDLRTVWPDHPGSREPLVQALWGYAKRQRVDKDFEGSLATTDELLNAQPDEVRSLMFKADLLGFLDRWDEARDTLARALELDPRNRLAKKKLRSARRKAKRQDEQDGVPDNG